MLSNNFSKTEKKIQRNDLILIINNFLNTCNFDRGSNGIDLVGDTIGSMSNMKREVGLMKLRRKHGILQDQTGPIQPRLDQNRFQWFDWFSCKYYNLVNNFRIIIDVCACFLHESCKGMTRGHW